MKSALTIAGVVLLASALCSSVGRPAPVNYFFPDLAPGVTTFDNKYFDVKVGFAVLADFTFIGQNSLSRAQGAAGEQI